MAVKFNEYWNLRPRMEEPFSQVLTRQWIPGMNELGITILAVWNVLVGPGPTFISEGMADDTKQVEEALRDQRHSQLNEGLLQYVEGYFSRVLVPTGLMPTLIGEPHHKAAKLNQLWDPIAEHREDFSAFLTGEFVPALEEMGLVIGGLWKTLVGPPPREILEGRAASVEAATEVLHDPTFRKLKAKLMNYVAHYESRMLNLKVVRVIGRTAVTYEYL